MISQMKKFLRCVILGIFPLITASTSIAQCVAKDSGIRIARYSEGALVVDVSLTKRIDLKDLATTGGANQWRLDDLTFLSNVPISGTRAEAPDDDGIVTSVLLDLSAPLAIDHFYRLTNPFLTFMGCSTADDEKPEALVKIKKKPAVTSTSATPSVPKKNFFEHAKSRAKADSDVYLSGTIEGAKGGKPTFSTDIKLERPIAINKYHLVDFRPYFNLQASSTKQGNADSMNFGGKFNFSYSTSNSGAIRNVYWRPTGGFESDRRFRNINIVTQQIVGLGLPGNKHTFRWRSIVFPFFGFELGRNLRSPVTQAANRAVIRGVAGATFYLNFDRSEDSSFSFEVDYTRRFLLRREISFTEDDNKNLIPLNVGKGPRDYVKATAEYDFSKFTGFTLNYEYGRLPPNFELVDSKYSVGLVFKFKYK